jgi:HEAT repeat protein
MFLRQLFDRAGNSISSQIDSWARDPSPRIRGLGVWAAQVTKAADLAVIGRRAATDADPAVRAQAVYSLCEAKWPEALKELRAMVHD